MATTVNTDNLKMLSEGVVLNGKYKILIINLRIKDYIFIFEIKSTTNLTTLSSLKIRLCPNPFVL